MYLADRLTLDAPKRTKDGYMAVRARAARTGVYDYSGREVDPDNKHGLRDQATVKVLRDEKTVFDKAAVASFIGKPITDDHPSVAVNAANWRDHARGTIMGAEWQEGGYLAFDLLLTDADAIAKIDAGKRELSNGYSAELEFGTFTAADGTACQARQTSIAGNHVALVDRGRAGSECAIKDFAICDSIPLPNLNDQEKPMSKLLTVDGYSVDVANPEIAEKTIQTLVAARDAANGKLAGLETQVATLTTEGTTKDAQIATLEQQLKDAKPTPAQLRDAGKALLLTAGKAKALGVAVSDEMDESQIMAATVAAKMGDGAKGWTADQIAASFAALAKDVKVEASQPGVQPLGSPAIVGDAAAQADAAWGKANSDLNAWRYN